MSHFVSRMATALDQPSPAFDATPATFTLAAVPCTSTATIVEPVLERDAADSEAARVADDKPVRESVAAAPVISNGSCGLSQKSIKPIKRNADNTTPNFFWLVIVRYR